MPLRFACMLGSFFWERNHRAMDDPFPHETIDRAIRFALGFLLFGVLSALALIGWWPSISGRAVVTGALLSAFAFGLLCAFRGDSFWTRAIRFFTHLI